RSSSVQTQAPPPPTDLTVGAWDEWPWTLLPLIPAAAQAAWESPAIIVWDFERNELTRHSC
ncbi:MAG: hypothetical protein V7636_1468, partial [Actinomycetota bacterium]